MKILIETIPHSCQRYPTPGDWELHPISRYPQWAQQNMGLHLSPPEEEVLVIRVSELGSWRMEALLAIHELTEALLCKHAGISQEAVDDWDKTFNSKDFGGIEPGAYGACPYHKEHMWAETIEIMLSGFLGVDWKKYGEEVDRL